MTFLVGDIKTPTFSTDWLHEPKMIDFHLPLVFGNGAWMLCCNNCVAERNLYPHEPFQSYNMEVSQVFDRDPVCVIVRVRG